MHGPNSQQRSAHLTSFNLTASIADSTKLKPAQSFFEYTQQDFEIIVTMKEAKAIAISAHIKKLFLGEVGRNGESGDYCPECKSRFIIMFRRRYPCALCFEDYCSNCLRYCFRVNCQACHSLTYAEVAKKLDLAEADNNKQTQTISLKLCAACFHYLCAETKTIYERLMQVEDNQSPTSRKSVVGRPTFRRKDSAISSDKDSFPKPNSQFILTKSRTALADELSESLLDPSRDLNNTLQPEFISEMDSLDIIEHYTDMFPELSSFKQEFVANVIPKFHAVLTRLDPSQNIEKFIGLELLVRIYSFDKEIKGIGEDFTNGDLVVRNGTIFKKLLRYRDVPSTTQYCHIVLVSLDSNNQVKIPKISEMQELGAETLMLEDQKNLEKSEYNEESERDNDSEILHDFNDSLDQAYKPMISNVRQESLGWRDSVVIGGRDTSVISGRSNQSSISPTHSNPNTYGITKNQRFLESRLAHVTDKVYVPLDTLVSRKQDVFNKITSILNVDKTENVNIIFSQHAIPFKLQEELQAANIKVIYPVSDDEMDLLSNMLNCVVCDYNVLGNQKIMPGSSFASSVPNFDCLPIEEDDGTVSNHLIVLDKDVEEPILRSVGMFVYSSDRAVNIALKTFLRENLSYAYYMYLEKTMLSKEKSLFDYNSQLTNKIDLRQVGSFSAPLVQELPKLRNLLSQGHPILTTKVTLVKLNADNAYMDLEKDFHLKCDRFSANIKTVKNVETFESPKEFDNFLEMLSTPELSSLELFSNLNLTKVDFLAFLVNNPVTAASEIYSKNDRTLGIFLQNRFSIMETICPQTKLKAKEHVTLIYIAGACIRISADDYEGEIDYLNMKNKLRRGKKLFNVNFIRQIWLEHYLEQNKQITEGKQTIAKKKDRQTGKTIQGTGKKDNAIVCAMVCDICHLRLSASFQLTREYLNMSYLMFLLNLAIPRGTKHHDNHRHSNIYSVVDGVDDRHTCNHPKQARAFTFQNKIIKFCRFDLTIFDLKVYRWEEINKNNPGAMDIFAREADDHAKLRENINVGQLVDIARYYRRQMLFVWLLLRDYIEKIGGFNANENIPSALLKIENNDMQYFWPVYCTVTGCLTQMQSLCWVIGMIYNRGRLATNSAWFVAQCKLLAKNYIDAIMTAPGFSNTPPPNPDLIYFWSKCTDILFDSVLRNMEAYSRALDSIRPKLVPNAEKGTNLTKICIGLLESGFEVSGTMGRRATLKDIVKRKITSSSAGRTKRTLQGKALEGMQKVSSSSDGSVRPSIGGVSFQEDNETRSKDPYAIRRSDRQDRREKTERPSKSDKDPRVFKEDSSPPPPAVETRPLLDFQTSTRKTSTVKCEKNPVKAPSDTECQFIELDQNLTKDSVKAYLTNKKTIAPDIGASPLPSVRVHIQDEASNLIREWQCISFSFYRTQYGMRYHSVEIIPDPFSKLSIVAHYLQAKAAVDMARTRDSINKIYAEADPNENRGEINLKSMRNGPANFTLNLPILNVSYGLKEKEVLSLFNQYDVLMRKRGDTKDNQAEIIKAEKRRVIYVYQLDIPFNSNKNPLKKLYKPEWDSKQQNQDADARARTTRFASTFSTLEQNMKKHQKLAPPTQLRTLRIAPITEKDAETLKDLVSVDQQKLETQYYEKVNNPPKMNYSLIVKLADQFDALRNDLGIDRKEFVLSLKYCAKWASTGGKTESDFFKTDDKKYVGKLISKIEYEKSLEVAPNYFQYVQANKNSEKASFLCPILGIYEIKVGGEQAKYLVIMDNLFYGLENSSISLKVYDLKGSRKNRLRKEDIKGTTLMDTNFDLERNGDLLAIRDHKKLDFFEVLDRDCRFLMDQKIVDYSLLLIIDQKNRMVKCGIIDYLRKYDFIKMMEHKFKKMYTGQDPTIVRPEIYANRFFESVKRRVVIIHDEEILAKDDSAKS